MSTFEEQLKDSVSHAYDIERELGGGGMSRVFVATDRSLGRKIVIKLLSPELTAGVNRERFRREIQVAAQLQHPHIVPLLSAGEQGEIVYYTMPFIEGESLKTALERGPLPVRDVIRVLYDVVDALGYAHAHGVIHRDIKPANILMSGSHALVTDFGVAKALSAAMPSQAMTQTGMAIGTPAYMAPEQLAGDPNADHRIDIYAVGLMAYELLSGQSPFAALSPQAVMAALFTVDPKPLNQIRKDVPKRLSAIIMQCLSKSAADRPASAEALLSALDTIATSSGEIRTREHKVPVPLPPTAVVGKPRFLTPPTVAAVSYPQEEEEDGPERGSRKFLVVGGIAALILAGLVGGYMFTRGAKPTVATVGPPKAAGAETAPAGAPAARPGQANEVAVPVKIDSMAIAAAIAKRLAQSNAAKTPGQTAISADSMKKLVQRQVKDSLARANAAAATSAQAFAAAPAAPPAAPAAPPAAPAPSSGKPKLAIGELRASSDQAALTGFSHALVDALHGTLDKGDAFAMVDQDAVHGAMGRTKTGEEVAKLVNADVMIIPSFSGTGDTVNISVAVRDLRPGSRYGFRVISMKAMPAYPQYYVGPLVQAVLKQVDALPHLENR